ncbi:MAG: sulfite exporter TauE/SafE family protein [Vicinamibacterales bacterium]
MEDLLFFAAAGFVAQAIDGALGMAYGVSCTSLLLTFGYSPAVASASVHMAEVVTSGISGHFHWRLGNVDTQLFRSLVWPGMIGGAVGAYALSALPGEALRPWIAVYLGLMGIRILIKALNGRPPTVATRQRVEALGFVGGLMDAMGGGGWGPIVTSTLVGRGHEPRMAIGSVNRAEFFVTLVQSATFIVMLGASNWQVVLGLCLGGALAAPIAAHAVRRLKAEHLMVMVGILIVLLSLRTLVTSL